MLRVATLNLWGKQGPWAERQAVLRTQLEALHLDAIGLQEVIAEGDRDQARELADALGMHSAFGAALTFGAGAAFGNAIISRFPIVAIENERLPGAPGVESRSLLSAMLETPFGPVPFFVTHLAWRFDEGALRMRQVIAIARGVDRRPTAYPAILVGDFNAEPDSDEIRFLRGLHTREGHSTYFIDTFAEAGRGDGATFARRNPFAAAVGEPDRRIDYVFVRGRDARGYGRPVHARLAFDAPPPGTPFGSDHFGVVADLEAPSR